MFNLNRDIRFVSMFLIGTGIGIEIGLLGARCVYEFNRDIDFQCSRLLWDIESRVWGVIVYIDKPRSLLSPRCPYKNESYSVYVLDLLGLVWLIFLPLFPRFCPNRCWTGSHFSLSTH